VLEAIKVWPGKAEPVARLVRRPTLTASARDSASEVRVGTKKWALRSNKETDEGQRFAALVNSLTKNAPYKACSGFTHVTARRIAQPPKAAFVTRLQPCRLPSRTARQLPDQSTTLWVESSSTSDPRLRGALPRGDIVRPFQIRRSGCSFIHELPTGPAETLSFQRQRSCHWQASHP